jgi:hypothetical protein
MRSLADFVSNFNVISAVKRTITCIGRLSFNFEDSIKSCAEQRMLAACGRPSWSNPAAFWPQLCRRCVPVEGLKKLCITQKTRVKIACVGASLWSAPRSSLLSVCAGNLRPNSSLQPCKGRAAMVMVVLTSMSGLWTEACASPGAPADEPGVQDGSQQATDVPPS